MSNKRMKRKLSAAIIMFLWITVLISVGSGQQKDGEEISGKISHGAVYTSIPSYMEVGKVYTIPIPIENTGHSPANFTVYITGDEEYFYFNTIPIRGFPYLYGWAQIPPITLNGGEARIIKFVILAQKQSRSSLAITTKLYGAHTESETTTFHELDCVSNTVFAITNPLLAKLMRIIIGIGVVFCIVVVLTRFLRVKG